MKEKRFRKFLQNSFFLIGNSSSPCYRVKGKMKNLIYLLLFILSFFSFSQESVERLPIRSHIGVCNTFFSPYSPKASLKLDLGTGFQLTSNHSLEDFSKEVDKLIESHQKKYHEDGKEVFYKGSFYITGVGMGEESLAKSRYLEVLKEKGLDTQRVNLKVLSFSQKKIKGLTLSSVRGLLEKTRYWFPSLKRDYEKPFLKEEVLETLVTTAIIELGSVSFILSNYQGLDAYALLGSHTALILSYDVYKKFLTNWVLRPQTSKLGGLLKQLSLSLPFVVSYNIAGNLSEIIDFIKLNGMEVTTELFLSQELPQFATTQMVTLIAQTLFYRTVMSDWLGAWWSQKSGSKRLIAKSVQEKLKIPILALNAYFFAMASSGGNPLFSMGEFGYFNMGHLALGIMASTGMIMAKTFPNALDPLIKTQALVSEKIHKLRAYFKRKKKHY